MKLYVNSCDGIYDSVDIRFTSVCDNNCEFCIEKNGIPGIKRASPEELYFSTISTGIKDILILGGEPLLALHSLETYVSLIRDYADSIYLTTSVPLIFDTKTLYSLFHNLDGINVSLNSTDNTLNNAILHAAIDYNRTDVIKEWVRDFGDKIRVNLNLVKGGIDTKKKLGSAIYDLVDWGINSIKINELQHAENMYVSFEEIMNIKMKSPYSHGCNTEATVFGVPATIKRSCFMVEESRKASLADLTKLLFKKVGFTKKNNFRVIYEDGSIKKGWINADQISQAISKK